MRYPVFALLCAMAIPFAAAAQTAPAPAPAPASDAAPAYSSAGTDLGTLLDNPATKAVLEKHIPELISNDQIQMARSLTLKGLQQYAGEVLTDAKLAAIDADLAKVPAKK